MEESQDEKCELIVAGPRTCPYPLSGLETMLSGTFHACWRWTVRGESVAEPITPFQGSDVQAKNSVTYLL